MKQDRAHCVLYTTATCNLKCIYCYIDKSPVLQKIDKMLEDSYKGDYYFNFMKKMFDQDKLEKVEFWGGEPTYGLHRAFHTLRKAIPYFSNLHEFHFSTNLATGTCVDDILNFLSVLGEFPERRFLFTLQMSIDGPTDINDFNRGQGTTEKFTQNFCKLLYELNTFLHNTPNVSVVAHFKPTLDIRAISMLQTKEDLINYYKFLDEYSKMALSCINLPKNRWEFYSAVPNVATPSPITTQDGQNFTRLCKAINEIAQDGENQYFTTYSEIMPFVRGSTYENSRLDGGCGTCGTGHIILGLLPNDMISTCHNGFVELISEYKQHAPEDDNFQIEKSLFEYNKGENNMICTLEEYEVYEKQVQAFCPNAVFQTTEMAAIIRDMARANQIDKKYEDLEEAVRAAHFIQNVTSSCIRDNLGVTGSRYLFQLGNYRLFLNGAREEIQKYARRDF